MASQRRPLVTVPRRLGLERGAAVGDGARVHRHHELRRRAQRAARRRGVRERGALPGRVLPHRQQLGEAFDGERQRVLVVTKVVRGKGHTRHNRAESGSRAPRQAGAHPERRVHGG